MIDKSKINLIHKLLYISTVTFLLVLFFKIAEVALYDSRDFEIIYLSSMQWLEGNDPYNATNYDFNELNSNEHPEEIPSWPSIYPIFTFPLISPLTLLNWSTAKIVWMIINCVSYLLLLYLFLKLVNISIYDSKTVLFLAIAITFHPVDHAIIMGQPVILAILLGMLSWYFAEHSRTFIAGLFLSLSIVLKLNIGIIFLGYYIIYRKWNILLPFIISMFIIFAIAILNMGFDDISWVNSWLANMNIITEEWATNQTPMVSSNVVFLLNLQYPLYKLIPNELIVYILVFLLGFIEFLILLKYFKYNQSLFGKVKFLLTISTIVILSSYHRLADASILILFILFFILLYKSNYRIFHLPLLIFFIPLYLPGPRYLQILVQNEKIPASIAETWWWNSLILPYQVYSLLLLSFTLMILIVADNELQD